MLHVLIIESAYAGLPMLKAALCSADCDVSVTGSTEIASRTKMSVWQPDVVIFACDTPDAQTLERVRAVNRDCHRPIMMFTEDARPRSIRAATQAGVTSYIVGGIDPVRIRPILDVALARFDAHRALHQELEQTRQQLQERKLIDQAKAQLIREDGSSETEVYRQMRRMAMDRGARMADVARQILQRKN